MEIIYNHFGIGMTCTDGKGNKWIELNRHLKDYQDLHDMVLNHEIEHYHNLEDRTVDMKIPKRSLLLYIPFLKKHPVHCLESMSPFMNSKVDGFALNNFNLVFWVAVAAMVAIGSRMILRVIVHVP